ncbi:MAG: hypothetical protein DRP74_04310 [Candidatus Omnitrophota bacterium]|nr:MAG: hypothetical protein DRP74_04310 [Candidatus Omnitrophota bacterium]
MKRIIKIPLILAIVVLVVYTAIYVFLLFAGKGLLTRKLTQLTAMEVKVGELDMAPPLNFRVKNLIIQDLFEADSLYVSTSLIGFLTGKVVFNQIKITRPQFKLVILPPVLKSSASKAPDTQKTASLPAGAASGIEKEKKPPRLAFKYFLIEDGSLDFTDYNVGEEGITIKVHQINSSLTNLFLFPRSVKTKFKLSARIPWEKGGEEEEGKVEAEGWLNLFKKNMQATVDIRDINGIYLYPYYANWVDLEGARIEEAKLNFSSKITSVNNDLNAACHLELTDIVRRPLAEEEEEDKASKIADAVLSIFKAFNQGKVVLDFNIKTKMDAPRFGFNDIRLAFEDKLTAARKKTGFRGDSILTLPIDLLKDSAKSASDISRAIIEGAISMGTELKKVLESPFSKNGANNGEEAAHPEKDESPSADNNEDKID